MVQFEDPDNRVPFQPASKLITRCVEVTKCHHFGLLLGEHAEKPKDFIDLLHQQLRYSLANQEVSVADIAMQLGIHERTLHRRLKIHGTNFHHELELTRYAISRQLLTETNQSNTNIAITLGYSNVSAFSRAFKKWSGESPAKWRKKIV